MGKVTAQTGKRPSSSKKKSVRTLLNVHCCIIDAPNSGGKTVQADKICKKINHTPQSTCSLVRLECSSLLRKWAEQYPRDGQTIKTSQKNGDLVPERIMKRFFEQGIVQNTIEASVVTASDCGVKDLYLVATGFLRDPKQPELFFKPLSQFVINSKLISRIKIQIIQLIRSPEFIRKRMQEAAEKPRGHNGQSRPDDQLEVAQQRLDLYYANLNDTMNSVEKIAWELAPILPIQIIKITTDSSIDQTNNHICSALKESGWGDLP